MNTKFGEFLKAKGFVIVFNLSIALLWLYTSFRIDFVAFTLRGGHLFFPAAALLLALILLVGQCRRVRTFTRLHKLGLYVTGIYMCFFLYFWLFLVSTDVVVLLVKAFF